MRTLLLALALCSAAAQAALDVQGVKFEDRVQVGNTELKLSGAGMRAKFFLKVYVVGLYAAEKKAAATEMLTAKGAKRLHIVTLRELTGEQFADALVEGIRKNSPEADVEAMRPRIEQFKAFILALKTAPKGTVVQIDWLPESGTRLVVDGQKRGEDIPGEDFYRALLKIWLGEHPAQDDLKDALLGKPG